MLRGVPIGVLCLGGMLVVSAGARADATTATPMVTVTMSRTEVSAADMSTGETGTCVRDDRNIATLDGVVLPWIESNAPRLHLTGSVETGETTDTSEWCAHYGWTRSASWAEMQQFQADYGMRFISHSSTYPLTWAITPREQWLQTCGSRDVITAHGLLGAEGQFDWPNNLLDATVQASYVQPCFDFNRVYGSGSNTLAWSQSHAQELQTLDVDGGSCAAAGRTCSTADGTYLYKPPATIINAIKALRPGQEINLQAYVLVKGTNPAYSAAAIRPNRTRWNCNSSNPAYHWSNDVERYCWKDFRRILSFLQGDASVVLTDPAGVAAAWGAPPLPPEPPEPAP